ncbi:MAG: putative lipopolysaccharide heptosyltransferase III [Magnetococcales bacterium]|nr:putative lipopolysaccharide heptosyltransferase III [Magnetococcales bacterium]MBF0321758.1 putative lipopolysaccharide heptosyltransferase III [Magnetococcales bacterium]
MVTIDPGDHAAAPATAPANPPCPTPPEPSLAPVDLLANYGDLIDLTQVQRVLVILLRHIGDVILTTPVFSVLQNRHPHLRIDALVNEGTEGMLADNPHINVVHVLRRQQLKQKGLWHRIHGEWRLLRQIRQARYNLAISLTGGERSTTLAFLARIPLFVSARGGNTLLGGWIHPVTHLVRHTGYRRHYVERHLDCLRHIGVHPTPEERRLQLYDGHAEQTRAEQLVQEMIRQGQEDGRFILYHPTSRWMFKAWPSACAAALVDRLATHPGLPVVLTASPDAREMAYIQGMQGRMQARVINLAGQLTLRELVAMIRRATLFVGVDSAPMHMAAAVGTPVVALFGPSSEWDWGPWCTHQQVVASTRHPCRPCNMDGCGGGKVSDCLTTLPVETVHQAILRLLEPLDPQGP